jgi:hypothetical protein
MNIEKLKHAIAQLEGFFHPGTVPARLHNPGDLMFAHQPGAEACPIRGIDGRTRTYAEFPSDDLGWQALERQIRLDASRGLTLQEFIRKYAPASDANDPTSYLAFVMRSLGVTDATLRLATVIAN